jgi:predicted LPLAT superfamily acyltransferase
MPRPAASPVGPGKGPDWVDQPERSSTAALRFMAWVALALGRPVARALLYPICLYFLAFSPRARSASRQYLSRVLGRDAQLADLFRHYHSFACVVLDRVFLLNDQFSGFDVRIHGAEIIDECLAARTRHDIRQHATDLGEAGRDLAQRRPATGISPHGSPAGRRPHRCADRARSGTSPRDR